MTDAQDTQYGRPPREARYRLARAALTQGDLLRACDLARAEIADDPSASDFAHIHVLALARMGQRAEAEQLYRAYGLESVQSVEAQSLGGRLLKDAALAVQPADPAKLNAAAEAYLASYRASQDPFPGVNAASLFLMSGRGDAATALASEVLAAQETRPPSGYFDGAGKAEALLVLGQLPAAQAALEAAVELDGADPAARMTTRRQFERLANSLDLSPETTARLLAPIAPTAIASYCGHMFESDPAREPPLAAKVAEALEAEKIGVAYGSLARGADIVIAEQVLARGAELNVVLPFEAEAFVQASVGDGPWRPRFERCLAEAKTVTFATTTMFVHDPHQFRFGSEVAMGLACLRSEFLGAEAVQIAVWDGSPPHSIAGTAATVGSWRRSGGRTIVIPPTLPRVPPIPARTSGRGQVERTIKAILFTDFAGFSRLREDVLPAFWTEVMDRIADVTSRNSDAIAYRNTWGDALFAVVNSAGEAASIALELQDHLASVDHTVLGIDRAAGMRIGAHLGPVYSGPDKVTGGINFFGTEVNRAARMEPVTPPGAVYVSEAFAATLTLQDPDRFTCAYVGQIELPKAFGSQRMYRLSRKL